MTLKGLTILKKGFEKFKKKINDRKKQLEKQLGENKPISLSDEEWLDNEANLVDETRIIETLENASDYERGVDRLDEKGKEIVQKLKEWAGDLVAIPGNK